MAQQGGSNSGCSISGKNCLELWAGAYLSHHPGLSTHRQAFWFCLSHDYYSEKCSLESSKAGGSSQEPINNNPVVKQNDRYYEGLNWWAVCNNPLLHSNISLSCDVLVTQDKNALTSKGKVALEGILCPRVHPLLRR